MTSAGQRRVVCLEYKTASLHQKTALFRCKSHQCLVTVVIVKHDGPSIIRRLYRQRRDISVDVSLHCAVTVRQLRHLESCVIEQM